jgi:hypothetical protein
MAIKEWTLGRLTMDPEASAPSEELPTPLGDDADDNDDGGGLLLRRGNVAEKLSRCS